MELRVYQKYAIDSIFAYYEEGNTGNPIIAMPPGTGKSVVIAGFVKRVLRIYPKQRILMLTHVQELIAQNFAKLITLWPTAPAGIFSAGLGRKEIGFPITYAGIASIVNILEKLKHIDLVLIDECHTVSDNNDSMYLKCLRALSSINPNLKVIGFSATPFRLGIGHLVGNGRLFTRVAVDMTAIKPFNWFLDEGYLCRLIPKKPNITLDDTGIRKVAGEYDIHQQQKAFDKVGITSSVIDEIIANGKGRNHWLVFASGIEHVEHMVEAFNQKGIKATCVHSKLAKNERVTRLASFERGQVKVLVNNGVLTTGYDFPAIDLIAVVRLTNSPGLWVQILGRGIRPVYSSGFDLSTKEGRIEAIIASPKPDCLVLDFAKNTERLGPINDPVLPEAKKGDGGGQAPYKACPECGVYNHASARICWSCQYEFPREVKFSPSASHENLIKGLEIEKVIVEKYPVTHVTYAVHRGRISKGVKKPISMKISYLCAGNLFREWVCFEHTGYARVRASKWWKSRASTEPPATVAEAISRLAELSMPIYIKVAVNRPHKPVVGYDFAKLS